MPVLTLVDVTGIQRFVFGSSRLRQVAGASALLQEATAVVPGGWLESLGYSNRVIVANGGNTLLNFSEMDEAKAFAAKLSKRALLYAPELEMVIVHESYQEGKIGEAISHIYQRCMPKRKAGFMPRGLILNLGISEECFETGQVASVYDREGNPISVPTTLKDKRGTGHVPFDDFLSTCEYDKNIKFRFPLDIDRLGRTPTESSLVGVVHLDANNTGGLIAEWINDHENLPDEDFVRRYKEISRGLSKAVEETVKAVIGRVQRSICKRRGEKANTHLLQGENDSFELYSTRDNDNRDIVYLPIRPIIAAGEDITFVCDGRIALDLAAFAIEEFEHQVVPELGTLTACAGVSIAHAHSPFLRSYEMAEQLCSNAKKCVRGRQSRVGTFTSAIDWHITSSSTIEGIGDIRQGLRATDGNRLSMKPYLFEKSCQIGTWQWFVSEILYGRNGFFSSTWACHRSKVQNLQHIITRGQHEVRKSLDNWKLTSDSISLPESLRDNDGFVFNEVTATGMSTPIIDASELFGLFISLGRRDSHED